MEDYHIALLTRGRIDKQKTLQMLHPITRKLINIYCHPGELKEHKKNWKGLVNSIQEYGKECKNQSEARDYIIKKCKSKYVIFLDDNLRFQTRLPSKK